MFAFQGNGGEINPIASVKFLSDRNLAWKSAQFLLDLLWSITNVYAFAVSQAGQSRALGIFGNGKFLIVFR